MLISEIFHSIQGEGELTGVPSVFVRTSGCNLRCDWCDTKYASWNPEGTEMSQDDIVGQVTAFPSEHCVLTGGEPMVAKGIHDLAARLKTLGKHITVESAATIPPNGIACDLASLSPKLRNSTPSSLGDGWANRHDETRLQPEIIQQWIDACHFQLKFVVASEQDIDEIDALLAGLNRQFPPSKVLLMPQGINEEALRDRANWLIELCKRRGFRYCSRLHIHLFGNTRGT